MSDWTVEEQVTCVVCPDCAFTFDRDHTDEGDGYSCPACSEHALKVILTDLITELVGDDGDGHKLTPGEGDTCLVCEVIDRAEVLLREVSE